MTAVPEMLTARADVPTDAPERYAKQLVSHLGRKTEFTTEELLLSHDYAEPLIANGVRCHGGFDDEGRYLSPRTRFRGPAIDGWEQQRVEQFATPILDIPLESWPDTFPNVEQTKFLTPLGQR